MSKSCKQTSRFSKIAVKAKTDAADREAMSDAFRAIAKNYRKEVNCRNIVVERKNPIRRSRIYGSKRIAEIAREVNNRERVAEAV